jgi:hypothetical protein
MGLAKGFGSPTTTTLYCNSPSREIWAIATVLWLESQNSHNQVLMSTLPYPLVSDAGVILPACASFAPAPAAVPCSRGRIDLRTGAVLAAGGPPAGGVKGDRALALRVPPTLWPNTGREEERLEVATIVARVGPHGHPAEASVIEHPEI